MPTAHRSKSVYLVTGAAGFIGYHLAAKVLETGKAVVGVDNLNNSYSVQLKRDRLARLFIRCSVFSKSIWRTGRSVHPCLATNRSTSCSTWPHRAECAAR